MPLILSAVILVISLLVQVYLGFTFVTSFVLISIISDIAGFSIMGVAPILFQYGSESAYPVSEGTSLGIILLMGQISGAMFVWGFEALSSRTGTIILPMLFIVCLTAIEIPITMHMKESKFKIFENSLKI